jgi:hypothetical protein
MTASASNHPAILRLEERLTTPFVLGFTQSLMRGLGNYLKNLS